MITFGKSGDSTFLYQPKTPRTCLCTKRTCAKRPASACKSTAISTRRACCSCGGCIHRACGCSNGCAACGVRPSGYGPSAAVPGNALGDINLYRVGERPTAVELCGLNRISRLRALAEDPGLPTANHRFRPGDTGALVIASTASVIKGTDSPEAAARLADAKWEPEDIHRQIYEAIESSDMKPKDAFGTFYTILLGQRQGPRLGYFLSQLDKEFVIKRIEHYAK